ncbi:MAG: hypothetical protein IKJ28_05340 [Alphaproteobacteria bacterium]|nr:hypothetical protein [Alphaproteobacteria bacterium]
MTKLNQESGRSMVEMLGVLAIIGVLSIGGIAGYTMAMNRYKANEVLNAASMLSIAAQSANAGEGDSNMTLTKLGYGADTLHGVAFEVTKNGVVSLSNAQGKTGISDLGETIASISGKTCSATSCKVVGS